MVGTGPLVERVKVDHLDIEIYATRWDAGCAAARRVESEMRTLLAEKDHIRMLFASAPSQRELLSELSSAPDLDWGRVTAFHMDEYVGLGPDRPESFVRFLHENLYDKVKPKEIHSLNGKAQDLEAECRRYSSLLVEAPIDVTCAGIGENGHLAFNDPAVADFCDVEAVKVVNLDSRSREQQVNDDCFPEFDAVPARALTLTIPSLMAAGSIYCVVPGPTKAEAICDMLLGPISTSCPATILRRHESAVLYLDIESAGLFQSRRGSTG